jgi:hypothetical protein
MGFYNSSLFRSRLDSYLKSKICPISKFVIEPCSEDYKSGFSIFHYVCRQLHPEVKIGISGSIISNEENLYDILKNDNYVQEQLMEQIRNCQEEEFLVTTAMVKDILTQMPQAIQRRQKTS